MIVLYELKIKKEVVIQIIKYTSFEKSNKIIKKRDEVDLFLQKITYLQWVVIK